MDTLFHSGASEAETRRFEIATQFLNAPWLDMVNRRVLTLAVWAPACALLVSFLESPSSFEEWGSTQCGLAPSGRYAPEGSLINEP